MLPGSRCVIVRETVSHYNRNGEPVRWYYEAVLLKNYQEESFCGHKHRGRAAAEKCGFYKFIRGKR